MTETIKIRKLIAQQEHDCNAAQWILESRLYQFKKMSDEDLQIIEQAKAENFKIKKGAWYKNIAAENEDEFLVFRARLDLDAICHKYKLYIGERK
ncbi:hypothetical protein [Marinicellulosiphila megalodicopiae]|uniref:hypothetical protein n=1 Tax=Marinicellulosiphila megalodicopiae TaxID=2724896 RepID=UPI003BAF6422